MISVADITTDHAAYALRRGQERARLIPLRRIRRVAVGDMVALEFENAQTLTYQVQEMVYTERLCDPAAVRHEVEVYSRLLPSSHQLTATLLIELEDPATVRAELARLTGLQHSVHLLVGAERILGLEIPGPDEDPEQPSLTTASVHMLRFPLTDAQRDAFRDPSVPAAVAVDHPEYSADAPLTGATRQALLADLSLGTPN